MESFRVPRLPRATVEKSAAIIAIVEAARKEWAPKIESRILELGLVDSNNSKKVADLLFKTTVMEAQRSSWEKSAGIVADQIPSFYQRSLNLAFSVFFTDEMLSIAAPKALGIILKGDHSRNAAPSSGATAVQP